MTQENVTEVVQDVASTPAVETLTQSSNNYAAPTEKMVPQSTVDKIVKSMKLDNERQLNELRQRQEGFVSQVAPTHQGQAANDTLTKDDVSKMIQHNLAEIAKRAEEDSQQREVNNLVNNFRDKMLVGKERYQDFENVVESINYATIPNVVLRVASEVDNVADVMYELGKNPLKLVQLEALSASQPHLARQELRQLSESIKVNDKAKDVKRANEPLRQLTQSNVGIDDGSDPSVADMMKMRPWRK